MLKPPINPKQLNEVQCPDCGLKYMAGAQHDMFCPAKTCDSCGTTFSSASALHLTGVMIQEEDGDGVEIERPEKWCDQCWDDDRNEAEEEEEDD